MIQMPDKQFNIDKKKYIKEINSFLICDFGTRNKFIGDLKSDIDEYIENNSVTDFDSVYNHFGEPQNIAKGFLETADTKKIKRKMNITKVAVTAIIIALVMFGVFLAINLIDAHQDYTGYEVSGIRDASIKSISFLDLGEFL